MSPSTSLSGGHTREHTSMMSPSNSLSGGHTRDPSSLPSDPRARVDDLRARGLGVRGDVLLHVLGEAVALGDALGELARDLLRALLHLADRARDLGHDVLHGLLHVGRVAPERARGDNVYEAAAEHFKKLAKAGKRPLLAAYSKGSRQRIASILSEAGTELALAESWQDALGKSAKGKPTAMILPLDSGFASEDIELVTEQDLLGDRLVRRRKKRRDSDAFLSELQAMSRGDLVVHTEHGIGKYLGLEPITVGKSKHDCVILEYKGGDKLFIPVENIDVLSRYGSSEEAVMLDRLGGEAWQKRRARLKERINEIAGDKDALVGRGAPTAKDVIFSRSAVRCAVSVPNSTANGSTGATGGWTATGAT